MRRSIFISAIAALCAVLCALCADAAVGGRSYPVVDDIYDAVRSAFADTKSSWKPGSRVEARDAYGGQFTVATYYAKGQVIQMYEDGDRSQMLKFKSAKLDGIVPGLQNGMSSAQVEEFFGGPANTIDGALRFYVSHEGSEEFGRSIKLHFSGDRLDGAELDEELLSAGEYPKAAEAHYRYDSAAPVIAFRASLPAREEPSIFEQPEIKLSYEGPMEPASDDDHDPEAERRIVNVREAIQRAYMRGRLYGGEWREGEEHQYKDIYTDDPTTFSKIKTSYAPERTLQVLETHSRGSVRSAVLRYRARRFKGTVKGLAIGMSRAEVEQYFEPAKPAVQDGALVYSTADGLRIACVMKDGIFDEIKMTAHLASASIEDDPKVTALFVYEAFPDGAEPEQSFSFEELIESTPFAVIVGVCIASGLVVIIAVVGSAVLLRRRARKRKESRARAEREAMRDRVMPQRERGARPTRAEPPDPMEILARLGPPEPPTPEEMAERARAESAAQTQAPTPQPAQESPAQEAPAQEPFDLISALLGKPAPKPTEDAAPAAQKAPAAVELDADAQVPTAQKAPAQKAQAAQKTPAAEQKTQAAQKTPTAAQKMPAEKTQAQQKAPAAHKTPAASQKMPAEKTQVPQKTQAAQKTPAQPAPPAAPVKKKIVRYRCSNCKGYITLDMERCPHCGARLKKKTA